MPMIERSLPTTVLRKVKRDAGWGRWPAYVVAQDVYGVWVFSPRGSIYHGQVGERVIELEVGQGDRAVGVPVVQLLPTGWWTATWWEGRLISVDVCTPPELIDNEWTYIDLELDPHRYPDGRVVIEDEDEFATACEAELIGTEEAVAARAAADWVEQSLRKQVEPFGSVGWTRLEEALRLDLTPLTELDDAVTA